MKECCQKWESNSPPSAYKVEAHPTELPHTAFQSVKPVRLSFWIIWMRTILQKANCNDAKYLEELILCKQYRPRSDWSHCAILYASIGSCNIFRWSHTVQTLGYCKSTYFLGYQFSRFGNEMSFPSENFLHFPFFSIIEHHGHGDLFSWNFLPREYHENKLLAKYNRFTVITAMFWVPEYFDFYIAIRSVPLQVQRGH